MRWVYTARKPAEAGGRALHKRARHEWARKRQETVRFGSPLMGLMHGKVGISQRGVVAAHSGQKSFGGIGGRGGRRVPSSSTMGQQRQKT